MQNRISYFSGTGNSLQVTRDLASGLGDCEIRAITAGSKNKIEFNHERIGFVFPVYAWGPPSIVTKFVKGLQDIGKNTYLFCAVTYKNEPGAVLSYFSKILNKKGLKLNAGFEVCMPGNHIAYYKVESEKMKKEKFEKWKQQLSEAVNILISKSNYQPKEKSFFNLIFRTGLLYKLALKQFPAADKIFFVNEKCNSCEICKKICPANNIIIKNGSPSWKHNCEQCLACLHWCPQEAVEFGQKTVGKRRYQNPSIKLKDMLKKDK